MDLISYPRWCGSEIVPSDAPFKQTLLGVLVILISILVQLELFAILSRQHVVPSTLSRKLTHIGSGSVMTTALVLFPSRFWPARLAVSMFLVAFMMTFAVVAYLNQDTLDTMPAFIRMRLEVCLPSVLVWSQLSD